MPGRVDDENLQLGRVAGHKNATRGGSVKRSEGFAVADKDRDAFRRLHRPAQVGKVRVRGASFGPLVLADAAAYVTAKLCRAGEGGTCRVQSECTHLFVGGAPGSRQPGKEQAVNWMLLRHA